MDKFIDVSKCEWSRQIDLDINIICTLNSAKKCSGYCKDNPNCVFKQLKHKEQECDRLKHDNDYQVGALEKTIDQLKAENETYKKMFEDEDVRLALNEVRTGERHLWFNKAKKLEQTLTEIKEIAELFCNACQEFEPEKIDRNCMYCNYGKILQKISEVHNA